MFKMLKKFLSFLTLIAMLGTMISLPVFADAADGVITVDVTAPDNTSNWNELSTTQTNCGLYGKPDDDVSKHKTFNKDGAHIAGSATLKSSFVLSDGDT